MAFKMSLTSKAQQDEKVRKEGEARKRLLAEFNDEHDVDDADKKSPEAAANDGTSNDVIVPTGAKRHFTNRARSMKSGPGTLEQETLHRPGPADTRFKPQFQPQHGRGGPPAYGFRENNGQDENVYTTVIAKASNLPPETQESTVEQLFAEHPTLNVVRVERLPPPGPGTYHGRPSVSMKVTFGKDTKATDLELVTRQINDKKYIGRGYYLHLDRYMGNSAPVKEQEILPFRATWVAPDTSRGFAPTAELGGAPESDDQERLVVTAWPPPDLPTLRLIHTTIDYVIQGGMEFEAALMEDPRVQTDERYAWLYDQKHPLNQYYRYKMYRMATGSDSKEIVLECGEWEGPDDFPDEYATELAHLEADYEEPDEDEVRAARIGEFYPGRNDTGNGILPLRERVKFLWLLATLPAVPALAEDIAAPSMFAIEHATKGLDEIVAHIVSNILEPFSLTPANPDYQPPKEDSSEDVKFRTKKREVTLNALRVVSDVAFTTYKQGGKCWKYREAIGTELLNRKAFEYLDTLPERLDMGRTTDNQFREQVNYVILGWKDEHLFSAELIERFDDAFNLRKRQKEQEDKEKRLAEKRAKPKPAVIKAVRRTDQGDAMDVDVEVDMKPAAEPENMEIPMAGLDDQGPPSIAQEIGAAETEASTAPSEDAAGQPEATPGETAAARARRMRPKAEDMFASDEE
jgi:U2-associated protein SR140